eukprot:g7095.t1
MRVQAVMSKSSGSSEMVHKTCKVEEVMLIDLADACRSCSEEVLQRTPARIAVNEATADTAVPSASAPVATRAKHQKARMVGQSRHCTHRFARAARAATGASTAKKARRTIGKSLNARVEPVPVAQSSFDPSTVRNSVQIGLRISSTLRSEKGRESKSPSSLEGSDMSILAIFWCQVCEAFSKMSQVQVYVSKQTNLENNIGSERMTLLVPINLQHGSAARCRLICEWGRLSYVLPGTEYEVERCEAYIDNVKQCS